MIQKRSFLIFAEVILSILTYCLVNDKTVGHKWIARLCFALSNNRTKIPHFKRLLSGGMSHRIFLFILDFILSMTLNSHVHADRHFRFQKCLLFVKLYIFLYLYSITLWTDQMHFPHNTFFLSAAYSPAFSGIHLRVGVAVKPLLHFNL